MSSFIKLEFSLPIVPVAQPRARAVGRLAKDKSGALVAISRSHGPPRGHAIHAFRYAVAQRATELYGRPPVPKDVPLYLGLSFVMPFPGTPSKRHPKPRQYRPKKPDVDNLCKAVMDALSGVIWTNDSQIAWLLVRKFTAGQHEAPSVTVVVESIEGIGKYLLTAEEHAG